MVSTYTIIIIITTTYIYSSTNGHSGNVVSSNECRHRQLQSALGGCDCATSRAHRDSSARLCDTETCTAVDRRSHATVTMSLLIRNQSIITRQHTPLIAAAAAAAAVTTSMYQAEWLR